MKLSPNNAILTLALVVTLSQTVSCTQMQQLGKSQFHQDRLHQIFSELDKNVQSFGNPSAIYANEILLPGLWDMCTPETRRQQRDQLQNTLSQMDKQTKDKSKMSNDLNIVRTLVDLAQVTESDADRSAYCNRAISIAEGVAADDPSPSDAGKMLSEISQIPAAGIVRPFEDLEHPRKMITVSSPKDFLYCRAELALKSEGLTWASLGTLSTLCRYLIANGKNSEAYDVCRWVDDFATRVMAIHPELLDDPSTKIEFGIANEFSRGPAGATQPSFNFLAALRGFSWTIFKEAGDKARAKTAWDQIETDEGTAVRARIPAAESAVAKARKSPGPDGADLAEALATEALYRLLSGDKSKALLLYNEAVNMYANLRRTENDTKIDQLLFDFAALCIKQLDAATGTAAMYAFVDAVEQRAAGGVAIYPNRLPQLLAFFDKKRDEQRSSALVEHVLEMRTRLRPMDQVGLAELSKYQANLRSHHSALL